MNLTEKLREHAVERAEQAALVDRHRGRDRVLTFGGLDRQVDAVARGLADAGYRPGERVLVFHPVSLELYVFLLACFRAGVVAVLADPSGGREFLSVVCRRARPKGFFGPLKARLFRWLIPEMRRLPVVGMGAGSGSGPEFASHDGGDGHPALLTFTSGSTGEPKGAVRTHGFLLNQHRALEESLELRAGEVDLITLPVFALANLASGLTSVLADGDLGRPGEVDPVRVAGQIRRLEVTRVTAAPAFFEAMLVGGMPGSVRKVFTGGAPVFPDFLERLDGTGAEVTVVYGSTEAEPISELPYREWRPEWLERIAEGAGLPVGRAVCDVAVLPDRFGEPLMAMTEEEFAGMCLGVGGRGEVLVAGPQVLEGYLDGRGDEETKVRVGERVWHRTGDAGWLDDAGCLWMLGRCPARVRAGERMCYPLEVEAAMRVAHPGLRCALVEVGGRGALVVEGECAADVRDMSGRLGIERVIPLAKIPMDRRHQSKVDYVRLRAALGGE
ncbi:MAG: AMP-binding protein [Verrucomicrobiota bacterium JB025]|nr:AMP-binding protein [Verrucomicrobiota bacterium JB025]